MQRETSSARDFVFAYDPPQNANPELKNDNRSVFVAGLADLPLLIKQREKITAKHEIPVTAIQPQALAESLVDAIQPYQDKGQ